MTYLELIQTLAKKPILLFATATTGQNGRTDKLQAVSYKLLNNSGAASEGTLYQAVEMDDLLCSQEYHRITDTIIQQHGLEPRTFATRVRDLMVDNACFSFNPRFQVGFLEELLGDACPFVHDTLLLQKGAEMGQCLDEKHVSSLYAMEQFFANRYGRTPSLRGMCKAREIESTAPADIQPVEYNADILHQFWTMLGQHDALIQASLL